MACHNFHEEHVIRPIDAVIDEYKALFKVVYAAFDREYLAGRIDYGVSLGTAWVTDKGYKYLKAIDINHKNKL